MTATAIPDTAKWLSRELADDPGWRYPLDAVQARDVVDGVRAAVRPDRHLFDYRREDFDFGRAGPVFEAAFRQAKHGRGIGLVRNLPRDVLSEREYELMTWGIGLHQGVPRPQGKASQYISAVRDAGIDYRSPTGRGYNSSSELDYHTDRADLIVLTCYNKAKSGGLSMLVSTDAAYDRFVERHPDLVKFLDVPVHFSRQGELRPGQDPTFVHPVVTEAAGHRFVRWNRNRARNAQALPGVPPVDPGVWRALDALDAVLSEPDVEYSFYLQAGDMQILNGHTTLHARTVYEDHPEADRKRLLFRLWLATPDGVQLPASWAGVYGSVESGSVRGGILGDAYDDRCRAFDRRQAAVFGMTFDEQAHR